MCTVTVLRVGDMLRLVCNRDESRQRPSAYSPLITLAGRLHALMPQDPAGRGTWIAANSAGLVFAILNTYPETPRIESDPHRISRGLIIPSLLECAMLPEVAARLDGVVPSQFAPFRLLVAGAREVLEFVIRGDRLDPLAHPFTDPLLFTSSGLGDALVDGPRRLLFEQMFATTRDLAAQQDAYHAHRWRDRPALSVHMSRPDACTVSTTTVEVTSRQVRMIYEPSHGADGIPAGLIIDREGVGRADMHALVAAAFAS